MNRDNHRMLGIKIGSAPLEALTSEALAALQPDGNQITFACANPHSLVEACRDGVFRDALNHADQVVADGVGIVAVGRLVRLDIRPRITGADYFYAIMNALNDKGGKRVFFMGSTPRVLERIQKRAAKEFPNIEVGVHSPPFGEWNEPQKQAVVDEINAFEPDVLWVGMTAPKQEKWTEENRHRINARVIGSIGAVFDFYAETHPRAPGWMHDHGLEWLYRLLREPRRMWRRNFISTPRFIWLVLQERMKKSFGNPASAA